MATDRDRNGNSSLAQGKVVHPLKDDQANHKEGIQYW